MRYWDYFVRPSIGFKGETPDVPSVYADVYVTAVNAVAKWLGSKARVMPTDDGHIVFVAELLSQGQPRIASCGPDVAMAKAIQVVDELAVDRAVTETGCVAYVLRDHLNEMLVQFTDGGWRQYDGAFPTIKGDQVLDRRYKDGSCVAYRVIRPAPVGALRAYGGHFRSLDEAVNTVFVRRGGPATGSEEPPCEPC